MTNEPYTFYLDQHQYYPVRATYHEGRLTLDVSSQKLASPRFRRHVEKLATVGANEASESVRGSGELKTISFSNVTLPATFSIAGRDIAVLAKNEDGKIVATKHHGLSVTEKRMLGTYHASRMHEFLQPYDLNTIGQKLASARASIIGDFHTHSSGHISAKGLLEVALEGGAYYPIFMLEQFGIELSEDVKEQAKTLPRVKFPPLEPIAQPENVPCIPLGELRADQLGMLEQKMAIADTEVQTFAETESPAYFSRYPIMKNKALLKGLISKVAEEGQRDGLKTIELSYVGLEDPDLFTSVHEAIFDLKNHEATKDINVRLKFGIPRTYPQKKIEECLKKAKIIAGSPYVTAIDFLGYEDTKTEEFSEAMENLARWAHKHKPHLMFCVHAGENDKNLGNVMHALQFAKKMADEGFPITLRIGHGVYGLNQEALDLAQELAAMQPPRVIFELNPESNMALNNIMHPRDLMPMVREFIKRGIPFVPGSDSFGQYQTDHAQLAQTFIDMGFDEREFSTMKSHQEALQRRMEEKSAADGVNLNDTDALRAFCERACAELAKIPKVAMPKDPYTHDHDTLVNYLSAQDVTLIDDPNVLPEELAGKKPVTLIGASGSSWERISPGHQHQIAVAYDMLIHALNPDKAFIAQGRNKNSGISKVITKALKRRNEEQPDGKNFYNVGFQADIKIEEDKSPYSHLTHMVALKKRVHIPDAITNFTAAHDGILIAAGGAAYTRDAVLKADIKTREEEAGWLYTMNGPQGASADKARGMGEKYVFLEGKELIGKLAAHHPDIFRDELNLSDETAIDKLYDDACERVSKDYPPPETAAQKVKGVTQTLAVGAGK